MPRHITGCRLSLHDQGRACPLTFDKMIILERDQRGWRRRPTWTRARHIRGDARCLAQSHAAHHRHQGLCKAAGTARGATVGGCMTWRSPALQRRPLPGRRPAAGAGGAGRRPARHRRRMASEPGRTAAVNGASPAATRPHPRLFTL